MILVGFQWLMGSLSLKTHLNYSPFRWIDDRCQSYNMINMFTVIWQSQKCRKMWNDRAQPKVKTWEIHHALCKTTLTLYNSDIQNVV